MSKCGRLKVLLFVLAIFSASFAQNSVGLGGGGSIYAPAISPDNSSVMFVSCDMTGLYRTTDGGQHWTMMDERSVQGTTSFSVAFDPTHAGHIVGFSPSQGLMESVDIGNSWSAFSPALAVTPNAAAFSSDSPARLLVGTSNGVYSIQNGVWQQALPGNHILRLVFLQDPTIGQQVAFAATTGGIYRLSQNGSWQLVSTGLPSGRQIYDIAGGADTAHYALYATVATSANDIGSIGGVYRYSSDNPQWTRQVSGLNGANGTIQSDVDCNVGPPQYEFLGVSSSQPDSAYLSALNSTCKDYVYKGTFSGGQVSWTPVYDGFQSHTSNNLTPGWIEPHPTLGFGWGFGGAALGFAVAPKDFNTAVYVNSAAVHVTTNGAQNWIARYTQLTSGTAGASSARWQTTGIDVTTTWNYYVHPDANKSNVHFIANTDIGLSRSMDSGATWVPIYYAGNVGWDNFYQLAFEYPSGGRMWAAVSSQHDIPHGTQLNRVPLQGAVLVSADDGVTWTRVGGSGLPNGPVVSILYAGGKLYASVWGSGVYTSADGGANWAPMGTTVQGRHVYQIRFDANGVLYVVVAGTGQSSSFQGGGLYRFVSGDWQMLSGGLEQMMAPRGAKPAPYDFAFDPSNTNIIYLCTGDVSGSGGGAGIYRYNVSTDTWTDLGLKSALVASGYHGDSAVAFAPFFINNILYVTTIGDGIWQSSDGGASWTEFKAIPFMLTQRLVVTAGGQMYITTFGGGVWKTAVPAPPPLTVTMASPTNGSTVSGAVTLSATASDAAGIAGVQFLVDGVATGSEITASPYNLTFDTTALANGGHSFAARARNTQNVTATSSSITTTVNNGGGPGQFTLLSALAWSPASPTVNQPATATFTVINSGGQAISAQYFLVGARSPSNGNVDFTASSPVTLQPGQSYVYSASRVLSASGTYSAWPAYYDGTNWIQLAAPSSFVVQPASPGHITLTTGLALSPSSPAVGQSSMETFTVQNTGGQAISVQYFLVGARSPSNGNVDFPASSAVTLQPGQSYTYSGSRSLSAAGTYTAWPAYYDGTNWIQLASPSSFSVH